MAIGARDSGWAAANLPENRANTVALFRHLRQEGQVEDVPFRVSGVNSHSETVAHDKRLGIHTAVEVWDPSPGVLVRTARVRSGEIYAVVMVVPLSPIDPGAYEVFVQFCRSIADRPG